MIQGLNSLPSSYQVFDVGGRPVLSGFTEPGGLYIQALENGLYFIQLHTTGNTIQGTFQVMR